MSNVDHAHEVKEALHGVALYPGHAPRRNTPAYNKTHQKMCIDDDTPCLICRVRHSTLSDPTANWMRARFLETHHFLVQDSLVGGVSVDAILQVLRDATDQQPLAVLIRTLMASVHDHDSLMAFLDSPQNMLVLCDKCHLGPEGIHNTSWNYFIFRAFAIPGWRLFDLDGKPADAAQLLSVDEHLQELEQAREVAEGQATAPVVVVTDQPVTVVPAPPASPEAMP
jgi:hypothetical protein